MPDEPRPSPPAMGAITNEELAAAIVEVASIQIEMVRQIDAAIIAVQSAGRSQFHPQRVLNPYPLMTRSQALIRWLLAHVPSDEASGQDDAG